MSQESASQRFGQFQLRAALLDDGATCKRRRQVVETFLCGVCDSFCQGVADRKVRVKIDISQPNPAIGRNYRRRLRGKTVYRSLICDIAGKCIRNEGL